MSKVRISPIGRDPFTAPPYDTRRRLGQLQSPKGEKTSLILYAIDSALGPFSVAEIQNKCTNVSVDMVRRVLKDLRAKDQVECLGRGKTPGGKKPPSGNWVMLIGIG